MPALNLNHARLSAAALRQPRGADIECQHVGIAVLLERTKNLPRCRIEPRPGEASLNPGEWDEAQRYAQALEDYTRQAPLPWAEFWIAWGRALASHGRDPSSNPAIANIEHVLHEAQRIRMQPGLPALQRALARS